jgi:hypothetical protein
MKNAYDKFMIDEILPAIKNALTKEDKRFNRLIKSSVHSDFYLDDTKGIASYILVERTLQYIIFRELCKSYKIFPEDRAYNDSKERLDLSIYKNNNDPSTFSEIGVEFKIVSFTKEGELYKNSLEKITSDFDKIKRAGNENKYILMMGLHNKKIIDFEGFNQHLNASIDNRKFRKFHLKSLALDFFRTDGYKDKKYYIIMLLKVE